MQLFYRFVVKNDTVNTKNTKKYKNATWKVSTLVNMQNIQKIIIKSFDSVNAVKIFHILEI